MTWYRRSSRFMFDALFRRRHTAGGPTTITSSTSRINIHDGSKRRSFFQRNFVRSRLLGLGYLGLGVYYYSNLERVPFTNRSHFMIYPTSLEKSENRNRIKSKIKSKYEGKILPPDHPSSIRVRRIGQRILGAAQKGLRLRKNNECIPQYDWEFLLVDIPKDQAYCYPGGKIVMCTGRCLYNKSDADVAAGIGHEVGHAIARHYADNISKLKISKLFLCWSINLHLLPAISKFLGGLPYSRRYFALLCRAILMLFLYWKANLSLIPAILKFLIKLPDRRRNEEEADYIGLILMALAGYDPRVSVEHWEKRAKEVDDVIGWSFEEYARTHPSHKKRAQLLSQPKVMEEALSLYRVALRQRRAAQFHAHRAGSGFQRFSRQVFRSFLIRDRV